MQVIKRNGQREDVSFDKILKRIRMCIDLKPALHPSIDAVPVSQKVVQGIHDGVTTVQLDDLAAETAASLVTTHPDYGMLAARIAISNLHKQTSHLTWLDYVNRLHAHRDDNNELSPLVSDLFFDLAQRHHQQIEAMIDIDRDFLFEYFGFKTLSHSYLLKTNKTIIERPQWMWMRVALGIHGDNLEAVKQTYDDLSTMLYTHATPTLFNAGTPRPQMSSCFLMPIKDDSIQGIYETLLRCALISKEAGGIGLSATKIRAAGSYIRGTGGESNGIVPMLRNFNSTACYVDQGGNKRKGAFAVYLEPWHAEILDFLALKLNSGKEERRARDLFYGLWIPDLFMKRVNKNEHWSLFSPNDTPDLGALYGDAFEKRYIEYEKDEKKVKRRLPARDVWFHILESQIETGTPYMLYKDACNRKNNQSNLGTLVCSNLCTEILEYCSRDEVAVCNLATVSLKAMFDQRTQQVNYELLQRVVRQLVRNLNQVIDRNFYPIVEASNSNFQHRPIGIGTQGQANLYHLLRLDWESEEGRFVNRAIYEHMYYAALDESCRLAESHGAYSTFKDSPASKGILQFDMWRQQDQTGKLKTLPLVLGEQCWNELKQRIIKHGLRNSLLIALPPTASTSQLLNNFEMFEPCNNLFTRRVLAGEFTQIAIPLVNDLMAIGLWTPDIRSQIVQNHGSIQKIDAIPQQLKKIYKTIWDLPQRLMIDYAAERGQFVCQSQSFNVYFKDLTSLEDLTKMHMYGWFRGLKTGMYYLRTMSSRANALPITMISDTSGKTTATASSSSSAASTALALGKRLREEEENQTNEQQEPVAKVCRREPGCTSCDS